MGLCLHTEKEKRIRETEEVARGHTASRRQEQNASGRLSVRVLYHFLHGIPNAASTRQDTFNGTGSPLYTFRLSAVVTVVVDG